MFNQKYILNFYKQVSQYKLIANVSVNTNMNFR